MLNVQEADSIRTRNSGYLRTLFRAAYGIGINLGAPTPLKRWLKVLSVVLIVSGSLTLYGQYGFIRHNIKDPAEMAECACTALLIHLAVLKMVYFVFRQQRFSVVLNKAISHELLQDIEVFQWDDLPLRQQLKEEIDAVMDGAWRQTRGQLIFFMCDCAAILLNYFLSAFIKNLYHYLQHTPNYVHVLPTPGFYPVWENKGMSFPYYPLQMYIHSAALYIVGMCAVSFEGVFMVASLHATGVLRVLRTMLRLSTSPLLPKHRRVQYLRACICLHQRTDDFLNEVQGLFQHITLPQFLLSLLVNALVLYEASVSLHNVSVVIRMVMYMAATYTKIAIYCYNGQRLTDASEELPTTIYDCAWYDESGEFKQLLLMMIMRTNRTFHLDISWFTTMSLATLLFITQTSGSYFLLMQSVTE